MLKPSVVCALLAFAAPVQASAESWLCITDMATGFSADKTTKIWTQANFKPVGRYIIKPSTNPRWKYIVSKFGESEALPEATCNSGPNEYGYLNCEPGFGDFKFNSNNLRFIRTYIAGYVEIGSHNKYMTEGNDDPGIEIGRCSKL